MEHDYDLLKAKEGTKNGKNRIRRKSMRRFMAMLLSAVLAAGTCLPAMAVEQPGTQTEESDGAASADLEQAAEVQPEEGGEEASAIESPEEAAAVETGSSGEADDEAADSEEDSFTEDNPEETEAADAAGTAMTDDASEAAAEEETEAAVEPEETTLSGAARDGNLLKSEGNSDWLNDYSYSVTDLDEGMEGVRLEYYYGADTVIEVPGTAQVEGVTYQVTANDSSIWPNSIEEFTFGRGFIMPSDSSGFFSGRQSLVSVDLSQADTSRVTSMYNMFNNCENLRDVNLGSIDVSGVTDTAYMFSYCSSIEELNLTCFSGTGNVTSVDYMFERCSRLRRLDLGGWGWSQAYYAWGVFEGCDNLEELIIPENVSAEELYLPRMMADQNGNIYKRIPVGTDSLTLTTFEVPGWLDNYDYSVEPENGYVLLEWYKGSDSVITMPESVTIAGKEYQLKVQSCPWGKGVTELSFEGSNPFYDYVDYELFAGMQDLEVLDLQNVNCSGNNYQSLSRCGKLKTIYVPANCPWGSYLPRTFKDKDGNLYSYLPEGLPNSIQLDAVTCSEWLEDYTYSVEENAVLLTGYYGDESDLVVQGSAVVDGKKYDEIWVPDGVWRNNGSGSGPAVEVNSLKFEQGVIPGSSSPSGYELYCTFSNMRGLKSVDFSEIGGFQIVYAYGVFEGCSNLEIADLSGYDFSRCSYAGDFFSECDSLKTVKTPVNVQCSIKLPAPFQDENGNVYTEIPMNLNESITLTRAEVSEWLSDYDYRVTGDSIVLLQYKKSPGESYDEETGETVSNYSVKVPGYAEIGSKEFNKIVLSKNIWEDAGVKELSFEKGVFLPEVCSNIFSYDTLEKIDLSEVNVAEAANMEKMFNGCSNLSTIEVPKSVSLNAYLPGVFTDEKGNNYTSLPQNVSESFTITKASEDAWLSDYDYYIAEDTIVLTGYHGYESNLKVPGKAVLGKTTYTKVEITSEIDWEKTDSVEYLSFDKGVIVPEDCSNLFDSGMLKSIDMSNIDTSHVTNMSNMFNCYNLTELDVSGFNTSNVTDMSQMFSNCGSLTELDVSKFNTSNVTDMSSMFTYCENITSLDVRGFNTSKVTNMCGMFESCPELTSLDVSGFDTSGVTDMSYMFRYCSSLTSLNVSGLNTESVKSIAGTFRGCNNLLELDLSSWDLKSLENGYNAFSGKIPVIKSPVNVPVKVDLKAIYTGTDGLTYDALPVNNGESILLTWTSESGDPGGNTSGDPSESGNPCEHVYGEWEVTKEATCIEEGSRERVCSVCGEKETETIKAKGHQWNEAYITDKEATCTEDGSESHHCTVCGAIDETTAVIIPAKGHSMTKTAMKEATCTEAGNTEFWSCSRCGKVFSDAAGTKETTVEASVIPAKGHSLSKTKAKEATCTEDGNTEYWSCSECGKVFSDAEGTKETTPEAVVIPAKHVLTRTEAKEAACTEEGNTEYWTCSKCGKVFSDAEGTKEITPDATVIPAKGHSLSKTEAKEAACTEDGNTEYWSCSECGKVFSDAEGTKEITPDATVIPAKGHSLSKTEAKEATCTEDGNTEYWSCSECGKMFSDAEGTKETTPEAAAVKSPGHNWSGWTVTKEATCTEDGSRERTCSVCEEKETEVIRAGHKWNTYYTIDKKPTATSGGYKSKHCSVCGEFDPNSVQTIPPLKGSWKKDSKGWWYNWGDGTYPVSSFEKLDGKTYYFNSSGYMVTGWQQVGGKWYYFDGNGAMVTGWKQISGKWYYLSPWDNGAMVTGLQKLDGKTYYFNSSGAMTTGWQQTGGKWYYFNTNGAMATGWKQVSGKWYYLASWDNGAMQTGWQKLDGKWYYFNSNGAMATGWKQVSGKWYYLNSSGAMATGWKQVDGKWYYLASWSGGAMQTGWQKLDGKWYYFDTSGAMVTGRRYIDGKWYNFSSSGAML